jgi:hypothetical protein
MDKSGIGDPIRHAELSTYGAVSFYLAVSAWVACVVFSQLAPKPYRGGALFWFGLMGPIATFLGWLGALGALGLR